VGREEVRTLVKIRLARAGNRNRPFYRIVAAEESRRRDGRFIEILGTYDPLKKPAAIEVKADSVLKWLSNGAQPTDTVKQILAKGGVWGHWMAKKNGSATGEPIGTLTGTIERTREQRPSKKTTARIQAEESEKVKAAEAKAKATADEAAANAKAKADEAAAAAAAAEAPAAGE
jgi:small subunit ribosomal protein S16